MRSRIPHLFVSPFGALALTAALALSTPSASTQSYFSSARAVGAASITAATFSDVLSVSPGKAKARFYDAAGKEHVRRIAQPTSQGIVLDFGDVPVGNSNSSPDVIRVKNLSTAPVTVDCAIEGALTRVVSVRPLQDAQALLLLPNQTVEVDMKLATDSGVTPGLYDGFVVLRGCGGFLSARYPARVRVFVP